MRKRSLLQEDRIFDIVNMFFLLSIITLMLYPFINVLSTSFSMGDRLIREGNVNLLPRGLTLDAYRVLLADRNIIRYYLNSIIYAVGSTGFSLIISSLTGYALSIPHFFFKKTMMILMTITLFFGGGLIPTYLLIKNLHLIDTIWVMIVPVGLNVWNVIIFRTFFMQLPPSLRESAFIDGASDIRILTKIILPISTPLLATFAVFGLVGSWNEWFSALLYLTDNMKHPVQMLLRKILISLDFTGVNKEIGGVLVVKDQRTVKAAVIIVTAAPIVSVYPFFQKYFTKGILVGSLKG